MGGGKLAGLTTGTFVRSRPVRTSFADLNGRELDGLARKLPRRQTELNVLPRCMLATDRKRKNLFFCASEIREVAREIQHYHRRALEKSSQHFYKKFAGINKLTAAFEI